MDAVTTGKKDRMNFRLDAQLKQLIEQAAGLEGQTLTEFAVSNLVQSARETIRGSQVTELSRRDWKAFMTLLDTDAEPNDALKRAARRHRKRRA